MKARVGAAVVATGNELLSHGLIEEIRDNFHACSIWFPHEQPPAMPVSVMVFIDAATLQDKRVHELVSLAEGYDATSTIIVNGDEAVFGDLIARRSLKGLFPAPFSRSILQHGIAAIRRGELWISRHLLSRRFEALRSAGSSDQAGTGPLTPKEWEVLDLIAEGYTNAAIAARLHVSPHTIKTHLQHIFKKIGADNRTQAAQWARQRVKMCGASNIDKDVMREYLIKMA